MNKKEQLEAKKAELEANSVSVMPLQPGSSEVNLSFSGIPIERIDKGIELLHNIISHT